MPRFSFESDGAEGEPLDNSSFSPPTATNQQRQQRQQQQQQQQQPRDAMSQYQSPDSQRYDQRYRYEDASPSRNAMPGAHPDSAFNQLRQNRRLSRDASQMSQGQGPYVATAAGAGAGAAAASADVVSPISLHPPAYRDGDGPYWGGGGTGYAPQSNVTPERNARESGLEAMRTPNYPQQAHQTQVPYGAQHDYAHQGMRPAPFPTGSPGDRDSHSSLQGLNAAAVPPGAASPGHMTPARNSYTTGPYTDDPYQSYAGHTYPQLGMVDPSQIYDDGDDGLEYGRRGPRTSMLSLGGSSNRSGQHGHPGSGAAATTAAAAGGAAAGAGVMGALGGLVGRHANGRDGSGQYDTVHNANTGYDGANGSTYDLGATGATGAEKSAWLAKQSKSSKKWKWLIIVVVGLLIAAGIALGIYFGVVKKNGGGSSGESAADDTANNGDLNINSSEIQALLNNKNLHKIFPGIDYTPINTQYPDCLVNPPSQNNVTRDMAVLSQLTNTIRLYGTDCNQTEMTIHAIRQLKMQDTIKIWMGVWQDGNTTTNARQLAQMWDILDNYGADPFKGVIVANEILFRKQMTVTELGSLLSQVRSNITSKGMSLPVATSDLGDNWTAELARQSDYIMANIHPFFGGINAKSAASWTWSFWENHNANFFKADNAKNVIAETGWPSTGGTDCGTTAITDCPDAAVAGIDEMNQFMSDWICDALTNGTQYFWFESFDEPWKIMYNNGSQNWEDHWGLMDVDRNLKKGVTIPDCGGKTVS